MNLPYILMSTSTCGRLSLFSTPHLCHILLCSLGLGFFLFADMMSDLKSLQPYSEGISQFYSG